MFSKNKKIKKLNTLLDKALQDGNFKAAQEKCKDSKTKSLLETSRRISNSAYPAEKTASNDFKQSLFNSLMQNRNMQKKAELPEKEQRFNFFQLKTAYHAIPAIAMLVLIIFGGYYISTFLPFGPSGSSFIHTVQAGEGSVPVSIPIKIDFDYPNATIGQIAEKFTIEPHIDTELSFDGDILTIEHEKNLKNDTEYTITIAKGTAVGETEQLKDDFKLTFSTRAKGQERQVLLSGYTFAFYTLNWYDNEYEIPLQYATGNLDFTVYETDTDTLLKAYYQTPEFGFGGDSNGKEWVMDVIDTDKLIDTQTQAFDDIGIYKPNITDPGIYYIRVTDPEAPNFDLSFFVVNTKHVIQSHRLGNDLMTWVVNQKTSSGVPFAYVTAYGDSMDSILFTQKTNAEGLLATQYNQSDSVKPDVLMSDIDGDISLQLFQNSWIYSPDNNYKLQPHTSYIFTDRPIYQPGDTVNFKAMGRDNEQGIFDAVEKSITITAKRSQYGQESIDIFKQDYTLNQYGTASGSFSLNPELQTGQYIVVMSMDGTDINSIAFNVEAYTKPDFEITVSADKEQYVNGEPINISVDGQYFFGEPLKNRDVEIFVNQYYGNHTWESTGSLNENGHAEFSIPTQTLGYNGNYSLSTFISVNVTDDLGNISSKTISVDLYGSEYNIDMQADKPLYQGVEVNQPVTFNIAVTHSLTGEPQSTVPLHVTVIKNKWTADKTTVYESNIQTDVLGEASATVTIGEPGSYYFEIETYDALNNKITRYQWFQVNESASASIRDEQKYVEAITITADKESYNVGDTAYITVKVPRPYGQMMWSLNKKHFLLYELDQYVDNVKHLELEITRDLVPNAFMHVSIFQDDIFLSGVHEIKVHGQKINVNIQPSQEKVEPGQDISLQITTTDIHDRPISAETTLSVIDKAIFALKADRTPEIFESFYPAIKDKMTSFDSLYVTQFVGAEFGGCFTGDTKILMGDGSLKDIKNVQTGDIILTKEHELSSKLVPDTVLNTYVHTVNHYLIINDRLHVTPEHQILINDKWSQISDAQVGDYMRDLNNNRIEITSIKQIFEPVTVYNLHTATYHTFIANGIYVHNDKGEPSDDAMRTNFVDTAYWNANVITDRKGKAQVTIPVPDNLTTWVSFAKSISKDAQVGQATTEFMSTKDLIVRPRLPKMFRTGDTIQLSAAIHNNTGSSSEFRTVLKTQGAQIIGSSEHHAFINNGDIGTVQWNLNITGSESAQLTFEVRDSSQSYYDGMHISVPIYSELNIIHNAISGSGTTGQYFMLDPDASDSSSTAVLTVYPSVLATYPDIIKKLTGYPYGCVEQTMSKHLPNIIAYTERDMLGISLPEDLPERLEQGFERLAKFQHEDGGFGWWEYDENNVWMSGYVMEGLILAQQAGLLGPYEYMYNDLKSYLKQLAPKLNDDPEAQIYVYYVLDKAEHGYGITELESFANDIINDTVGFDSQSQAYLILALKHNGKTQKAQQLSQLAQQDMKDGNHWIIPDSSFYDYRGALKDQYSTTGVNLAALVTADPNNQKVTDVVQWLMNNKNGYNGLWGSTRQSAQILMALTEYIKQSDEFKPDYSYEVRINDNTVLSEQVSSRNYSKEYAIPFSSLQQRNYLSITQNGTGNIYWSMNIKQYVPNSSLSAIDNPDLNITREYLDVNNNKVTTFTPGQLLKVRLKVNSKSRQRYALIEDYQPAGFSVLNPRLDSERGQLRTGNIYLSYSNAQDYRQERVTLFGSSLRPGSNTFEYLVRVGHDGTFTAPAPRVELMYQPNTYDLGTSQVITIK